MATILAAKTGVWSDPTVWTGGVLPGAAGANDNADSNGYTVTIDQNINLNGGALIGTSAGAGGFTVAAAWAITANVTATVRTVLTDSHTVGTVAITGNLQGGSTAGAAACDGSGAGGTLTITGSVTGGTLGTTYGLSVTANRTVNITGTVTGGGNATAYGVYHASIGTVAITGAVVGATGHGVYNNTTGTVTVSLTATGGTGAAGVGAYNAAGGSVTVGEAVGNNFGPGGGATSAPGVYGSATAGAVTRVFKATSGAYGQYPVAGAVKIVSDATNKHVWRETAGGATLIELVP